ncbi:MAG: methylamine methyltransferase corrinoid protein reductive activase [Candidatus Methanomethylophilaceae archaeon]|nr:methylamine methyltransferase corrinoid protein reductive activase [Candidatus Methanomethylophilaceae archaeon]
MAYGIALDIGTSGFRCQVLDLDTGKTLASSVTERHPIPGMNVIDHVNYAINAGEDVANGLMIEAINNLFASLGVDLSKVTRVAVCGNPFQLSLFQNIEIRDLAYAGKNMLKNLGVVSPPRDGDIIPASSIGIKGMPNASVLIPPAVTHEIGADAIAMLMMSDILNEKEPCIIVDYGTNAEMALIKDGNVYTGSAAAGPALEGQEIERGMLAAPGALSAVESTDKGWRCYVLDDTMAAQPGDIIDPLTGNVIEEGPMHGKAIGITGTGVVAALYEGMKAGIIIPPEIKTEDGLLHVQDGITITSHDVEEAGKAIGALRAGFLTLMIDAGIWVEDVKKAYMSGASGLYVDAKKAMGIGMVEPGARKIMQFGNTSIGMAREIILGKITMDDLKAFAKKLKATHCMFATAPAFKDIYSIEYSIWCSGMPDTEYNNMLDIYGIKRLPEMPDPSEIEVKRLTVRDLPDTENMIVKIIKTGTELSGVLENCIGCRKCMNACPEKALTISKENGRFIARIASDRCAGTACKRCEAACKDKVIKTSELRINASL